MFRKSVETRDRILATVYVNRHGGGESRDIEVSGESISYFGVFRKNIPPDQKLRELMLSWKKNGFARFGHEYIPSNLISRVILNKKTQ